MIRTRKAGRLPRLVLPLLLLATLALAGCQAPATEVADATQTVPPPATATALPPTQTPLPPTDTPVPPTDTPMSPTDTPVPPTDTPLPTDTPEPTPDRSLLINRLWQLVFLGDPQSPTSVLEGTDVNMVLTGERVTGKAGCNSFFGSYELDGTSISFGAIGSTLMACSGPIMEQEQAFFQALGTARTWRVSGDRLEIAYGSPESGEVGLLVFRGAPPKAAGLTLEALRNATYGSHIVPSGHITLFDGESHVKLSDTVEIRTVLLDAALGDLNGDGVTDGAVILATSGDGSGTFVELAAMVEQEGQAVEAGRLLLGDRVRVESISFTDGVIALEMITHGPTDPLCCPTQRVTARYILQDGALTELPPSRSPLPGEGPMLTDTNWVLTGYGDPRDLQSPLEATEANLTFHGDGGISGLATCNRFFGSYDLADGRLTFSPLGVTRMMCEQGMMVQEQAFLELMARVVRYEIGPRGELRLTTDHDQVLAFETQEARVSMIEITSPEEGAELDASAPIVISGRGRALFENNVVIRIVDTEGNVLIQQPTTMITQEVGGAGEWSIEVTVEATPGTRGAIVAFADSPRDGSVVAYDEVNVLFK